MGSEDTQSKDPWELEVFICVSGGEEEADGHVGDISGGWTGPVPLQLTSGCPLAFQGLGLILN